MIIKNPVKSGQEIRIVPCEVVNGKIEWQISIFDPSGNVHHTEIQQYEAIAQNPLAINPSVPLNPGIYLVIGRTGNFVQFREKVLITAAS